MGNAYTTAFVLANFPNPDGTDTGLRTIKRWKEKYTFNMMPYMCRANFWMLARVYRTLTKEFNI